MPKKQLTDKQKEELAARLAKAREAKQAKNPPKYTTYDPVVVALPDDHQFSVKNVKEWIKQAKEHHKAAKGALRNKQKGATAEVEKWHYYVNQLESYLRTGTYSSLYAGPDMDKKVASRCIAMAYYATGKPKRTIGVFYPDVLCYWTQELEDLELKDYGMEKEPSRRKKRVRKNSRVSKSKKPKGSKKNKKTAKAVEAGNTSSSKISDQ